MVQGSGEMAAAQADVRDLDRQVVGELMLHGHVELLRPARIPLLIAVELVAGSSEQHLLETGVASRIVIHAGRERIAHVSEERTVVVDAGRDVIGSLVHGVARRPIWKSCCRGHVERPAAGAQDRIVRKAIRHADTRRKLQGIFPQRALRLRVARHQLERTDVRLSRFRVGPSRPEAG